MDWISVSGDRLVDPSGRTVTLAGVGLGGWLNMENFITGFPATESLHRAALRRALGEEGYERFFHRFLTDFFAADDARYLASLGLNSVRVPFNYRHFEDDDRPFELKEEGFAWLDRVIGLCADAGLYTILDLHALPGRQNQHWHSDNPTHWAEFWNHRHFQDRVVHLWEAIAERYKDRPEVAGYNPVNEPADASGQAIGPFYERLERAVRAVDGRHVLFLDGNRYSTDFSAVGGPFPNTVYTAHGYALPGIAAGSSYPGVTRGEYFDRSVVERTFLRRTEFMRRTGTPIWIGEFGPVYDGDPERDLSRLRLLGDQLAIYRAHGASWSLWTYKDIGLQGLTYARADSAYVRRIAPVLEKKARLGADSWGGSDEHVRHILDPIDELFDKEFPGFDPYPWGRRPWIRTLVRNILLAEPLVGEFGRCFEGVSPQEAERLAGCFAFDACDTREPLAEVIRTHLGKE
ncbi:glycoside hydrolase family 5 protein [Nonomuraea jiangxiensis]|uniref:Aryl-phospho-beta-D-glucosidase BglC, GH1 family n=1 Tax=Nonomuraea jiangxiensis TaxID=633440 RepID=A0A1G8T5Q4_9ACTN|nr:cellulase family glycosylhydrolase [Nonomuraea jiangxiensis]SDJ36747.1 Aryl-phospho-beta-D-glucosidase BglC, GH1 family [Nonomuraea jiangxiensis]